MKIKSIFISSYKNIPEKEICFNTDLTSLIIGQNGLGKSNLLEALTLIFIALLNRDKNNTLRDFDNRLFAFRIAYFLRGHDISICHGVEGEYSITIDQDKTIFRDDSEDMYDQKFITKVSKKLTPDYFISYYSGQNERLKKIVETFEQEYLSGLKRNKLDEELTKLRNFLYLKNFHAPVLLLVLCVFRDFEKDGEKIFSHGVDNLFKHLDISKIESFSMHLRSPEWIKYTDDEAKKLKEGHVSYIHTTLDDEREYPFPFWGLKSSLNNLLRCLTRCVDIIPFSNEEEIKNKRDFKEFLNFEEISLDDLKGKIYQYFHTPLELFYAVEALVLLDILDIENNLKFKIKKGHTLNITFDLLSEGENQLLTVLGMVLITGSDETLFLLDEPDTYLNPKWQREYIDLLEQFNLEDDDSHIIVTTHSPFLVQNIKGDNDYKYDMLLLSRDEENRVIFDQVDGLFTNWRIDQVLASKYFDIDNTRPAHLDDFMKKRSELLSKDNLTSEDYTFLKSIEENDLLPSGETLNDFKAMHLIHKAVKRLPKEND